MFTVGGVSALAISLSLRNLLGNLFAGVLLVRRLHVLVYNTTNINVQMFYDTCRAGCIIRFVPAPGTCLYT